MTISEHDNMSVSVAVGGCVSGPQYSEEGAQTRARQKRVGSGRRGCCAVVDL